MNILLTGGLGFTGLYLQKEIAVRGHQVVLLKSDITDQAAVAKEIRNLQFDAVVHLAAISHVAHGQALDYYRVNVIGTSQLLSALSQLRDKPRRVLIASSANVYGNTSESPVSESITPAPVNDYAASKLAMEFLARARASEFGLVITRPFNYTGIGQSKDFLIPKLVDHFKRRAPTIRLGNIDVAREYNDVQMVCNAMLDLLEDPAASGTFNICSGQAHTLHDVIGLLQELTGHQIQIESDPALIRPHEIKTLYGSPEKLSQTLARAGKSPRHAPLKTLLETMLAG